LLVVVIFLVLQVETIAAKVKASLTEQSSPREILETLSNVFFGKYFLANSEQDLVSQRTP
jgi:hypothetical protein